MPHCDSTADLAETAGKNSHLHTIVTTIVWTVIAEIGQGLVTAIQADPVTAVMTGVIVAGIDIKTDLGIDTLRSTIQAQAKDHIVTIAAADLSGGTTEVDVPTGTEEATQEAVTTVIEKIQDHDSLV